MIHQMSIGTSLAIVRIIGRGLVGDVGYEIGQGRLTKETKPRPVSRSDSKRSGLPLPHCDISLKGKYDKDDGLWEDIGHGDR